MTPDTPRKKVNAKAINLKLMNWLTDKWSYMIASGQVEGYRALGRFEALIRK